MSVRREKSEKDRQREVKKYKFLLAQDRQMMELFERHDRDKSGTLPRSELLTLLEELATAAQRKASDADVDFVMSRCTADGDATVTFEELGPAVAEWQEAMKSTPPAGSSMCVLQ